MERTGHFSDANVHDSKKAFVLLSPTPRVGGDPAYDFKELKKAVFALTAVLALQAVAISNLIEWGYPSVRISDVRA